ncbi:hypothetical protein OPV22_007074 [Ensete ventricosum]|uniref:Uncharacterized protein n=1 Tax=Ensete ventricosum TaxID=4639 RepID=A0AAV8RTY3_ENSVE|nr:hypothetical protein OPV22_007074 [Ensete ventricosum]
MQSTDTALQYLPGSHQAQQKLRARRPHTWSGAACLMSGIGHQLPWICGRASTSVKHKSDPFGALRYGQFDVLRRYTHSLDLAVNTWVSSSLPWTRLALLDL